MPFIFKVPSPLLGWSLSNAVYDSKLGDASTETTLPSDVVFKTDGTKMYVLDSAAPETVYQYTLSTPFDVSTLSYDSLSVSVLSEDNGPRGIAFKQDGTKMYMVGSTNTAVFQYTLSTPWNAGTASYDSVSLNVGAETAWPHDVVFKPDGLKMYIIGTTPNDAIYQYTLSTAWDVSTASYDTVSFDVASEETSPTGMAFRTDGTRMFIVGEASPDTAFQYTLSAAWDVSTASYDSISFSVAGQTGAPTDITFKPDGTKMYIMGETSQSVFQYSVS